MSPAGRLSRWGWRLAQGLGLVATAALLGGLARRPEATLHLVWNGVVPLIPASLLVSPVLWRNCCPLATLNMLSNGLLGHRPAGARWTAGANALGIVLLASLVPARRFLLNSDGMALAIVIAGLAVLALSLGAVFDAKAGFCNGICPLLPVERLYGQRPLLQVERVRCTTCTQCATACLDLAPSKSIPQVLGRARHSEAWLKTPFGVFAGAFPGLVLAYFTASDSPLSAAGDIYLRVLLFSAASYLIVFVPVSARGLSAARVLPVLAALAGAMYYWFAAPGLAEAWGFPGEAAGLLARTAALGLIAAWGWHAVRYSP
ncbi:MAG: hypothetical protein ACE5JR_05905 [Gemmatimonadota bacterium]